MSISVASVADELPIALIFPVTAGSGAVDAQAREATTAIKTYLRDTGKVEAMSYDPESATVRRAIEEHRITSEEATAKTTPELRLKIGKELGVDYVATGVLSYESKIKMNLWVAHVGSRQVWGFDADAEVQSGSRKEISISNAVQSATSRAVSGAADTALKGVKPTAPSQPEPAKVQEDTQPEPVSQPVVESESPEKASTKHIELAEGFVKSGDAASAILEYRRAIDADPKNVDTRIKLATLYSSRQMFSQAQDELDRAQSISPDSDAIKQEVAKLKEVMVSSSGSNSVPARSTAKPATVGVSARINAGDAAWRAQKLDQAEKHYRAAIAADPGNIVAIERLSLLLLALGRFDGVKAEIDRVRGLDPNPDPKVSAERYARLISYVARHIKSFVDEYSKNGSDFDSREITREEYYQKTQGLSTRVESMIRLNEALTPPEAMAKEYRHQSLGLSLMSQACTHLISYLESNKKTDKDNAAIMMSEARKHLLGTSN